MGVCCDNLPLLFRFVKARDCLVKGFGIVNFYLLRYVNFYFSILHRFVNKSVFKAVE